MIHTMVARLRALPMQGRFAVFLAITCVVAALVSAAYWVAVVRPPASKPLAIGIVAPFSGPDAHLGETMRAGALSWLRSVDGRSGNQRVELRSFDSFAQPDALQRAAADADVVGVLEAPDLLRNEDAPGPGPAIPRLRLAADDGNGDEWTFSLSASPIQEARFLANYVRNVVGEKLVSIVMPDTPGQEAMAEQFDATLRRFGTRVVYRWTIPTADGERQDRLKDAAEEIASRQVAGALLILGSPGFAAETMAAMAEAKVTNRVIGLRPMATNEFRDRLKAAWTTAGSPSAMLNNTMITTPLLFDTSSVEAQAFRSAFETANRFAPDWRAMLAHDGAHAIAQALAAAHRQTPAGLADPRDAIRQAMRQWRNPETGITGLAGPIYFDGRSNPLPTLIGVYNGDSLIAAPVQLTPIQDQGVSDYLDQLRSGRMLYVNDRFMYRTNLVTVGMQLHKIINLNRNARTAELEFGLWFRWRGAAAPPQIVFENAVQPITLASPERAEDSDQEHYRAWRLRGTFFLNTSPIRRPFGVDGIGISFRHATLAMNNLMYVADVIGMDLAKPGDAAGIPATPGWLERLAGGARERASPLVHQMEKGGVLAGIPGFAIHDAFMSQDIVPASTGGDPRYVGFGKPEARFSRISLDVLVKPEGVELARLLPKGTLPYFIIFATAGAILARLLDRRGRGNAWRIYSLVLRLIAWPALLASAGTMILDYAVAEGGTSTAESINTVVKSLWWIISALLASMAVERLLWAPLEASTGRKIPTVFRVLVSLVLFVLGGFGIIAFVLGRDVTSLLATSGLLTFIIGMAIQSNLRDIFSGIMLNVERPFAIGDFVTINGISGTVSDISWRTTRLLAGKGHLVSLPNGSVVAARVKNLTRAGCFAADINVFVDPAVSPDLVIDMLNKALATVQAPAFKIDVVGMTSVENNAGSWAARYIVALNVAKKSHVNFARGVIWQAIWKQFAAAGLTSAFVPQSLPKELSKEPAATEATGNQERLALPAE